MAFATTHTAIEGYRTEAAVPRAASSAERQRWTALRPWVSALAMAYVIGGYLAGLACIVSGSPALELAGIGLLAHTMVLAGLLLHELIHRAVFRRSRANDAAARLLSLLNGACYVPFEYLRRQHMAHHLDKVGYDSFSICRWVRSLPPPARTVLVALEYLYVPVLSLVARLRALGYPFVNDKYAALRPRIALVLCARGAAFAVLGSLQPWSIASYFVAHLAMITVFRMLDCYHHSFDVIPLGSPRPKLAEGYEQANTYSSLLSRRHGWLNTIILNYGYHNAHHECFAAPWYRLPEIDRWMFGDQASHHIGLREWLLWYHRNRVRRILLGLGRPARAERRLRIDSFYGIIMNLSFMDYDYNDARR